MGFEPDLSYVLQNVESGELVNPSVVDPNRLCSDPDPDFHVHSDPDPDPT